MKKRIVRIVLSFLMGLGLFGGLFTSNVVQAANEVSEYRLGVSPSGNDFGDLKPDETYEASFIVKNMGTKDFRYTVSVAPYSVTNDAYDPDFNEETSYTEIKDWITVDRTSGEIQAGQDQKLNYTIKVPAEHHGGAQMAAIILTLKNENDNQGNIEAVRQLGYLVYGNVDGEVTRTGKVLENKVPSFLFNPPIFGTSIVENTGNVYATAKYTLQVFPLFSDEEIYTNEEEPESSIIFPETKRYNEIKWEGAPHLGIFKVRQTVKIFDDESVTEKIVFLCPIWFLCIALALIFCIIFWIVSRALKRKREA